MLNPRLDHNIFVSNATGKTRTLLVVTRRKFSIILSNGLMPILFMAHSFIFFLALLRIMFRMVCMYVPGRLFLKITCEFLNVDVEVRLMGEYGQIIVLLKIAFLVF